MAFSVVWGARGPGCSWLRFCLTKEAPRSQATPGSAPGVPRVTTDLGPPSMASYLPPRISGDEADSECEAAECTGALVVSCVGHIATAQWAVPLHSVFLLSFTIRRPEEILNHQQLMWASVVNTQPLTSLLVQNFLLINHCSFPRVIKILSVNCGGGQALR